MIRAIAAGAPWGPIVPAGRPESPHCVAHLAAPVAERAGAPRPGEWHMACVPDPR